jgi:DNA invertase Pin-like site-specific DNA recombinase
MTCALYARVSTRNLGQDPENQLLQLREFAREKKWKIVRVYEDRESAGGKPREQFQKLFQDILKPKKLFDVLLFWSLDRFSREGVYETLHRLKELDQAGVQFLSLQEQYLDTLGPFREILLAILAYVAELELSQLSERVKAGVSRARIGGKPWGRKPVEINERKLLEMRKKGFSLSEMAGVLKVSRTTVFKRLRQMGGYK